MMQRMKSPASQSLGAPAGERHTDDAKDRRIAELEAELAAKEAQWASERQSLFEQIRTLIDKRFGPSTEKYRIEQRDLFFDEAEQWLEHADEPAPQADAEPGTEASTPRRRRKRGGRAPLPPELPRVEVVHDLDETDKHCTSDGAALSCIGEQVTEQLDIIPAQLQVIRHVRRKYACKHCQEQVKTAALPAQPLPKSNASAGLLAYLATAKYEYGLPLYRQAKTFERLDVPIARQTLARWMVEAGRLLEPLIGALRGHARAQALIHMDETTVQVNTEPGRAASSPSYMWVQRAGPPGQTVVLYDYAASRSGQVPQRLLGDYAGILLTDGYEGYAAVVRANAITHAGCWAHARRKFVEAQKLQPKGKTGKADWALNQIAKLYRVERQGAALSAEQRLSLRAEHSQPLVEALWQWLEKSLPHVPPKGALGKALHYLHGQWPRLTRFLEDGRIPLDNNPAENAIRPFVIGRKNWLFSHTTGGAQASAALYSLIETAKANGLQPYDYLKDVFTRLPAAGTAEQVKALLPWNWTETIAAPATVE